MSIVSKILKPETILEKSEPELNLNPVNYRQQKLTFNEPESELIALKFFKFINFLLSYYRNAF